MHRLARIWFPVVALLLGNAIPASAEPALRRGGWAAFKQAVEVRSANDQVVRTAEEGEVVRVRILRGDWAEVGSSVPELAGGKVPVSSLRPSTPEENEAWVVRGRDRIAREAAAAGPLNPEPAPEWEAAREALEPPPGLIPPLPLPGGPEMSQPVLGWFTPGRSTELHSLVRAPDGSIFLSGALKFPVAIPGARGWAGPVPPASETDPEARFAFLARIAPDLASIADFVIFSPEEVGALRTLRVPPSGGGIWVAAERAGHALGGSDAGKTRFALLHFNSDLKSVIRSIPVLSGIKDFAIDAAGRPVVLESPGGRKGGGYLAGYFSEGFHERRWKDAPDGPTRRLRLDFSSPALADGPFALWARKAETLPDFPTPLGPWGSEPNVGQPVEWTNVKDGKNPIRGANTSPEALALDRNGQIIVSGTIPFHMGFPDFDPFLMRFSPSGKLLWTNNFLNGLLSEPDQKTQALAIDPSNGDILICYWQHGNNRRTLLLAPDGWLTQFTGTNGNIKITWIGRVDPESGRLKNSTYIYSRLPNPKNPRWPDLNSVDASSMEVNPLGWVFVAGATTINLPVTSNAWLPFVSEYGNHPYLVVIKPDLTAPRYATYLSPGQGAVTHMTLRSERLAVVAGTHKTEGTALPAESAARLPYLSSTPPDGQTEGVFLGVIPIPSDPAPWSFDN